MPRWGLHGRMSIIANRKVWLLALWGGVAFALARWIIPPAWALTAIVEGGYWIMLATVVAFVLTLWRLTKSTLADWRPGRAEWTGLTLAVAVAGVWQAHEERGFKILADEVLLLGTSMDIHYLRKPTYPVRATDVQGPFQVLQSVLDKRPFFFPFVVGTVHDLTGYRPDNPFYVNLALSVVFLGLVYGLARRLGGSIWAGVLGVLLFAGLPLIAQQAAGGGFELLNLVMMAGVLWLAIRYAETPNETTVAALCLAAVLLAQTRYESALMIVPVAALVVWGWYRAGRVIMPKVFWLLPVFLVPYVLQNRQFETNASLWELAGQGTGATEPFALHYLPDNLGHALAFFFDTTGYQPNSIVFAVLGLLALPLFCIWITRVLRARETQAPVDVAVVAIGMGLLVINVLFMVYFWGQFDHPVIHRLSLPLHLCMMLAVVVVTAKWVRWSAKWQALCAVVLLALIVRGLPVMAKRAYERDYLPGVEMAWRREFIAHHPARDYLFIDRDAIFWITQQIASTPVLQAQTRREGLAFHLRNHSFSAMYVFQRYNVAPETGALTLDPEDDPGPGFELEPVWEKRLATLVIGRISRIKSLTTDDGKTAKATSFVQTGREPPMSAEELEKVRARYLENWIKQLP